MDKNNQSIRLIGLGLTLLTLNNILGHFFPPFSIMATPIILPFIIIGINYPFYRGNYPLAVAYGMVLLLMNDLGIRFFAGGTHDQVGKTLITLCSTIAFIMSIVLMAIYACESALESNTKSKRNRLVNYLTSLIVLCGITYLFYKKLIIDI